MDRTVLSVTSACSLVVLVDMQCPSSDLVYRRAVRTGEFTHSAADGRLIVSVSFHFVWWTDARISLGAYTWVWNSSVVGYACVLLW